MTKLILVSVLVLSAMLTTAQPPQGQKPPSIEERIKRTNEVLKLEVKPSPEQNKTIENAYKTFFTAADKLLGNKPPDPQNQKAQKQLEKLETERDESIKKVLTAAQYKKYEAAAKKLASQKPGEKRGEGPPPPKNN